MNRGNRPERGNVLERARCRSRSGEGRCGAFGMSNVGCRMWDVETAWAETDAPMALEEDGESRNFFRFEA